MQISDFISICFRGEVIAKAGAEEAVIYADIGEILFRPKLTNVQSLQFYDDDATFVKFIMFTFYRDCSVDFYSVI